jgi:hypothetical protein
VSEFTWIFSQLRRRLSFDRARPVKNIELERSDQLPSSARDRVTTATQTVTIHAGEEAPAAALDRPGLGFVRPRLRALGGRTNALDHHALALRSGTARAISRRDRA